MKVSLNWLKDYIRIRRGVGEVADRLTMLGLEVENVQDLGARFKSFLVGEVREVRKHPSADRLTICSVNIGDEVIQIVCGAPNVAHGQRVAVALPGALVPHDQHDASGRPFLVSALKIRGESSQGMICSPYELDLGEDKDGIMVLDSGAKPGSPLAQYLGLDDTVLEIGVTPNRPDALCHIGIAREVGVIFPTPLKLPLVKLRESTQKSDKYASVTILDTINCPRYTARIVMGVSIGESPAWLKERLSAVGLRPVNNVVDVTNYVLMEVGQPLHAFDYDKIDGSSIVVKSAEPGEEFFTLDGKRRLLRGTEVMICDGKGPIALGGVMGGANTEISKSTRNILLESAYFNPTSIRRTSKYLGLQTDASQRFERGADPNGTAWAADRAASLIQEICGGEVLKGRIDVYPKKILPRKIRLRVERVNEVLGTSLDRKKVCSLLKKLSINLIRPRTLREANVPLTFEVPTRRPDIEREIDLIEEVARVYGYNNIETKTQSRLQYQDKQAAQDSNRFLRHWLSGAGYSEIVTNSMVETGIAALTSDEYVEIANPLSKDLAAMRTSLVPGIMAVFRNNIFHGTRDLRVFELGKAYFRQSSGGEIGSTVRFREENRLLLGLSGLASPRGWPTEARQCDMSDIKGEVEVLLDKIFLDKFKFIPYPNTKALTDLGLRIEINGQDAGMLGRIRGELLRKFEIEQEVYVAELAIDPLFAQRAHSRLYHSLPKYPSVMRDIALIVDAGVEIGRIEDEVRTAGTPMLSRIHLFDIYAGKQIGDGKKSCAFALEFMSEDHTLTQQDVDGVMKKIIDRLASRLHATLRS